MRKQLFTATAFAGWSRVYLLIVLAGAIAVPAWLWWNCQKNPETHFLPGRAPAEWILYPNPPDAGTHRIAESSAVFQRDFVLAGAPSNSVLRVSAWRNFSVKLNGAPLAMAASVPLNWKKPSSFRLDGFLRQGQNHLEVTVSASNGPPALWLALQAGGQLITSDESWKVSWAGAEWLRARFATRPMPTGQGHLLAGGERPLESLALAWLRLLLFGIIGFGAWLVLGFFGVRNAPSKTEGTSLSSSEEKITGLRGFQNGPVLVLTAIIILWVALFANNLRVLPRLFGFDVEGHLGYIQYLLTLKRLPLPNEGWSTNHPPLYYLLSALLLGGTTLATNDDAGVLLLRAQGLIFALGNILLVWAALRRLFPGRTQAQYAGLIVAAFIPPQIFLSQYVSNELLAATFVTASFFLYLRLAQSSKPSLLAYGGLGACLGLALLTKVSAILAVPFIFGAIAYVSLARRGSTMSYEPLAGPRRTETRPYLATRLRIGAMVIACALIAGWHYLRVWKHSGTPLVTNWDANFGLWQDEGYRTSAFYTRFGAVFHAPFFSGLSSFADGIYSTLWGDGLGGGATAIAFGTPWNQKWMAAGYLLALIPTFLIVVGLVTALRRLAREQDTAWIMMLGFLAAGFLALVSQSIKVPSYAQVKVFYLFSGLLPLSALAVLGWETCVRSNRVAGALLGTALTVWALNSFGTFWINAGAAPINILRGMGYLETAHYEDALNSFQAAISAEPQNTTARSFQAQALLGQGRTDDALEAARATMNMFPADAAAYADEAVALQAKGQIKGGPPYAVQLARRSIELAPDNIRGYRVLANILSAEGWAEEVVAVSREGLRVLPEFPELHLKLGTALAVLANQPLAATNTPPYEARMQLDLAARLSGDSPPALDSAAWILATHADDRVRDGTAAVEFAERANRLTSDPSAQYLRTLAAAYAETGRFADAIETARQASAVAENSGQKTLSEQCGKMIEAFTANQAYREPARLN